jgi:hypothetical protein
MIMTLADRRLWLIYLFIVFIWGNLIKSPLYTRYITRHVYNFFTEFGFRLGLATPQLKIFAFTGHAGVATQTSPT